MVSGNPSIFLSVLWGKFPRGIINCTRRICRNPSGDVEFKLARDHSIGAPARTSFNLLSTGHLHTSQGPFPVSLVELRPSEHSHLPKETVSVLHGLSLGFPIVGESKYINSEKFFNPVVKPPGVDIPLMLRPWIDSEGNELQESLSFKDFLRKCGISGTQSDSVLMRSHEFSESSFDGEQSVCAYTDHPESRGVRRDRGRAS
jgi:hypothetical protein